jgi:hypothetical protein
LPGNEPSPKVAKTGHRIADSILLGVLSLALAWGALGLALASRSGYATSDLLTSVAAVGCCSGPLFAAMNVSVVRRDYKLGRQRAALAGLALSVVSMLATLVSLAMID